MENVKLEFKTTAEGGAGIFYRYSIGSFQFSFVRYSNGNIYSVTTQNNYDEDVSLFVFCNEAEGKNGVFYPDKVEINLKHQRFYAEDSLMLLSKVAKAALIATEIENFFKEAKFDK